ncbi:hypothetical protein BGX27_010083 [Mortierella sp. AM989]|nr:hypothetical protein BGX27_010083 [Mortierella sp. AM989]
MSLSSGTARSHALELPEIVARVVWDLSPTDILNCSNVSTSFNNSFSPFVWQDLHFGRPCGRFTEEEPFARNISLNHATLGNTDLATQDGGANLGQQLQETLQIKSQLIRSLSIHSHTSIIPLRIGAACTRLKHLSLDGLSLKESRHTAEHWNCCKEMMKRNKNQLQSLSLTNWQYDVCAKPSSGQPRWNPILRCTDANNLTSLSLATCRIPVWNVQEVDEFANSAFMDYFLDSEWPKLDSIVVMIRGSRYEEDEYCRMLQSAKQPIRQFDVNMHVIGVRGFNLLATYFSTLESLDIFCCSGNKSEWVVRVLTNCPNLQILKAKIINAQDIIDAPPWACNGLREISTFIDMGFPNNGHNRRFTEEEIQQCQQVFEKLALFKELRILNLLYCYLIAYTSCMPYPSHHLLLNSPVPLPFRLRAGLGHLATLKRLEKVSVWCGKHTLPKTSLVWMIEHWKHLHTLCGGWAMDFDKVKEEKKKFFWAGPLKNLLSSRGISTEGNAFRTYFAGEDDAICEDCCGLSDEEDATSE